MSTPKMYIPVLLSLVVFATMATGQDPTVTPATQTVAVNAVSTGTINGPANAPFAYALSITTCSVPTVFGEFGLDQGAFIVVLDGINVGGPFNANTKLSAGGTFAYSGVVGPFFAGRTIYGQAIVMSPTYPNGFKLSTNGAGGPVVAAHILGTGGTTTLAGAITYGDPQYVIGTGYPGGASDLMSAVRFADIEAVNASSMAVLATGSTDAIGRYELTFPSTGDNVFVRVKASTDNNPKYRFRIRMQVNASQSPAGTEPIWSRASGNFPGNGNNTAADFHIPVNPGVTTNDFHSAPFNVMDVMIRVQDAVRSATGTLNQLHVYTTPNFGEQGAFYGGMDGANVDYVFLSGGGLGTAESTDTDFYDDGVIGHELGHFIETVFKGSSPGGNHVGGQRTIPPLAWGEGYGTFVGGVGLGSPIYADGGGYGPSTSAGFTQNLESDPSHGATPNTGNGPHGIFDETVVFEILWDLHDGSAGLIADTDSDGISISLAQLFGVFNTFDVNDYVYVIDMLSKLDSANGGPIPTASLTALMTSPEATGFTYPPVGIDIVPTPIAIGGTAMGTTDATMAGTTGTYPGPPTSSEWNRTAEGHAFFEFVATAADHTITLEHTSPAGGATPNDVDLFVTTVNSDYSVLFDAAGPGVGTHTVNAAGLTIGQTYLIWCRGWSCTPPAAMLGAGAHVASGSTTFQVSVN